MSRHLDRYFDKAVVEVEPPKGNFPFVNRCTLSGELLGPPNYHRYQQIVQQHHAARFSRMPFEQYREHIETVRDPEVVNQWLEKMKKATRYTWKLGAEGEPPVTFDSVEDARAHLLATARDRMVKAVDSARLSREAHRGAAAGRNPPGDRRPARTPAPFPAGHRQRLARDACAAKASRYSRKDRRASPTSARSSGSSACPARASAESIGTLIGFIEANPMITVKELPLKLLGFTPASWPVGAAGADAGRAGRDGRRGDRAGRSGRFGRDPR